MNEEEAKSWLKTELDVPRETFEKLELFAEMLISENKVQNLVARPTLDHIWARHIADSAQLLRFTPASPATWLDLGTGAGFPGLIIALLHRSKATLIEERKLRAAFLARAVDALGLSARTSVICAKIEKFSGTTFDVISARAFAPLDRLLTLAEHFATPSTRWVLPKGRNAKSELAAVESSWQGDFRLERSITDAEAHIIIAEQVRRRVKGKK